MPAANEFQEAFVPADRMFGEAAGFGESAGDEIPSAGETKHQAWVRESAGRMVQRADAAEKDLRKASLQELEALVAITFGRAESRTSVGATFPAIWATHQRHKRAS